MLEQKCKLLIGVRMEVCGRKMYPKMRSKLIMTYRWCRRGALEATAAVYGVKILDVNICHGLER